MKANSKSARLLWAAALLTIPSVATAQDNVTASSTPVANETLTDPAITDLGNDLGTASNTEEMALPVDNALANDVALAQTVPPEEDNDFPWGLLGLLGLAGLLGRKKHDDVYVDNRTDRRDV